MKTENFEKMCVDLIQNLRAVTPIDKGNLRYDAIRYEFIDANTFKIFVDESIAPYMPYTNEPWISPKWNGKKNPNEGWWDNKAYPSVVSSIRQFLGKEIVSERIK